MHLLKSWRASFFYDKENFSRVKFDRVRTRKAPAKGCVKVFRKTFSSKVFICKRVRTVKMAVSTTLTTKSLN